MTRYARIWRAVAEHAWAIIPEKLEAIVALLELRGRGERYSPEEVAALIGSGPSRRDARGSPPGIAVIPVMGIIGHRMNSFDAISGGTSTEALSVAFRQALSDPAVGAIVLDVDSPGGQIFGVQELADVIFDARGRKPIVAAANALAGSAAYWIASQADELTLTPSGQVGSIGVLAIHEEVSKAAEQAGVKVTYVAAGRYKTEGNPFEPLGDDARANIQARVDGYYDTFVKTVARGRGVAQKAVRSGMGEGRLVTALVALEMGMVDRVESFDATLARVAKKIGSGFQAPRAETSVALDQDLDERKRWGMRAELTARKGKS